MRRAQPPFMADLEWYFGDGMTEFYRSPFGAIMERQAMVLKAKRASGDSLGPWPYMHVKDDSRGESSYDVSFSTLHRFGMVSRALYRLEHTVPLYSVVLREYHGDHGSRWAAIEKGEGRLLSVYPLTETGWKWSVQMADRDEAHLVMRPDERLQHECMAQQHTPNDIRGARIRRMIGEAIDLKNRAHKAYQKVI